MGNSNTKEGEKLFNWVQIEPHRYKNLVTHQIIDHQQVPLQSDDILHAYNRRLKIVKPNIVQLVYYKKAFYGLPSCSQTPNALDVYVEGGLASLQQSLKNNCINLNPKCVCSEIIKAFQQLKSYFGPFQVHSNMVWLDHRKKVKVWVNKNYFLNQLISEPENLMVLQIRQILLKLNCNCNRFKDQNLSFKDLNAEKQEKKVSQRFHHSNYKDFNLRNTSLNQFIQHPFYYPEHYQQKKILFHTIKSRTHHSHTLNQNSCNTEKLKGNEYSIHKKTQHTTILHPTQQRKNHSEVLPTNPFSSSPKVYFHYQSQSVKQTPIKKKFQIRPYSEYNSPSQKKVTMKTEENFSHGAQSDKKRRQNFCHSIVPEEKVKFFPNNTSKELKKEQRNSNYQRFELKTNQRQSIKAVPFQLIQGHYTYFRYSINGKKQVETHQRNEKERAIKNNFKNDKIDQSSMNRGQISKNSFTDRSFELKQEKYERQREADEQKCQNQVNKIEYNIPQKTKKLIQKYLLTRESYPNKETGKQSFLPEKQTKLRKVEEQNLKNQSYWIRDRSIKYFDGQHIEREVKNAKFIELDENKTQIKQSSHSIQVKPFEENFENTDVKRGSFLQRNDREELKKEMEMIFNFAPQDEQQKNIKQKVAQKRAIFADLKKQAYKILDNSQARQTNL